MGNHKIRLYPGPQVVMDRDKRIGRASKFPPSSRRQHLLGIFLLVQQSQVAYLAGSWNDLSGSACLCLSVGGL